MVLVFFPFQYDFGFSFFQFFKFPQFKKHFPKFNSIFCLFRPAHYEQTAFSIVESVMEGFNGTIFAYGQVRI